MQGLMQTWALTLDKIIVHAAEASGGRRIASRNREGVVRGSTYGALHDQARRFSAALAGGGVGLGDRVGALMWNDEAHLTTWFGTMGVGAVVHSLNPRLDAERLAWMINHAGDRMLVIDAQFAETIAAVADRIPTVERIVLVNGPDRPRPIGAIPTVALPTWLEAAGPCPDWGGFDEGTAAGLCYTSGTTGDPKGVLYSHRSNFLHALAANQPNAFALRADDVVLPIVPMFHANAWGLPLIAPMTGAALVLPGPRLDGASIHQLIETEAVTFAAAVPTVWQDLLRSLGQSGGRLGSLRRILVGGAAPPPALIRAFQDDYGVEVLHGWGMTELSPLGAISAPALGQAAPTPEAAIAHKVRQGRPVFPLQARILDAEGRPCPHDDCSAGLLQVRGPAVARRYFGADRDAVDAEGWFDTGDIAVIDPGGCLRLVDRAKDVVKSGGEWISSVELENLAAGREGVARAAVIAVPDAKWGERPLLVVEPVAGAALTAEDLIDHLRPLVPKWWLPERVVFRPIPLGATGKLDKAALRRLVLP